MAMAAPFPNEESLRAEIDRDLEGKPLQLRYKHIAQQEDVYWTTIWRWVKAGRFPEPHRDDNDDPFWLRHEYRDHRVKKLLGLAVKP